MTPTFHDRLLDRTAEARAGFLAIPLIQRAVAGKVDRGLYLRYLEQAYHHVCHTVPLLARAISRCAPEDGCYRAALIDYVDEEKGHDEWILDDIAALGGSPEHVRHGPTGRACRIMCGHAYYLIDYESPYALLGMVHVLEGMSVALASAAATALAKSFGPADGTGFSYLSSHGSLDQDHVRFFAELVNGITDPAIQETIVRAANDFYHLYGALFIDLGRMEARHAA